jgi:hypothetical protein
MNQMQKFIRAIPVMLLAGVAYAETTPKRLYPQYDGMDVNVYLTVTPKPKREHYGYKFFQVTDATITADEQGSDPRVIDPFITWAKGMGINSALNPEKTSPTASLVIRLSVRDSRLKDSAHAHPHPEISEGYILKVSGSTTGVRAEIVGNSLKGVQHGLQSLRQLTIKWKDQVVIRESELVDWPDVPFRLIKRPFSYWLDEAIRYKMNGGTAQLTRAMETDLEKVRPGQEKWVKDHKIRLLYLMGMVNMGNLYKGDDESIDRSAGLFEWLYKLGYTHLALMNDDKLALADAEAIRRFGGYYETQLHYLRAIDKQLRKAGYQKRLAFMPNVYHGEELDEHWVKVAKGKLPKNCSLFLAGDHVPGVPVNEKHLARLRDQIKAKHLWYYTNWPQASGPTYAENWGASRHHDFGSGETIELVTVSTVTGRRTFPTSFITMADRLWNATDYDPDRSLLRAVKELVPPESFTPFYNLFKYVDSIAPYPMTSEFGVMYAADNHKDRVAILDARHGALDRYATACLATPLGKRPDVKKLLEGLIGRKARKLDYLAAQEEIEAHGKTPRELVCPLVNKGPKLDGILDDPVWRQAAVADRFTDLPGKKEAPHKTTVRVLRSKKEFFFAVHCTETHLSDPEFIHVGYNYPLAINKYQGTALWWAESIELFLDPGRDQRKCYQIMLNPWGLKQCFQFNSIRYGFHGKENLLAGNWTVTGKTNILKEAWTLEFSIPYSVFGDKEPSGTWGFNVTRNRRLRKGNGMKWCTWTPLNWGFQDARNFGKLIFKP